MTHLVNQLDAVVAEAVDGLVRASGGRLTRLNGYPDVKVVLRNDQPEDRVALVSGGGAGHEPAHAGFVGQGLLTAAVCGEVFASPSVDAVLSAIVAVTGEAGCLLIVKNYTGDRLTFGLAAERARALGLQVEVVVVADDVALPGAAQPRGLAGTLLVHKVAGALAEGGASLEEIALAARRVADVVKTLGVSLSQVAIPGRPAHDRIAEGTAELGLGIHGEPGAHTVPVTSSAELVGRMAQVLEEELPDGPMALLVNNLGGLSALEAAVVVRDLLDTRLGQRSRMLVGPAPLMTSLSAQGFSVSALPLTPEVEQALQAPVAGHTAWPGARTTGDVAPRALPDLHVATAPPSDHPATRATVTAICAGLIDAEERLNEMDARVGDGDTGSTFATAARRLLAGIDELPLADTATLLTAVSTTLTTAMGGSSGVLASIFFAAAGTAAESGSGLPDALHAGLTAVQRHGGAAVGDRTLLDALAPAVDALLAGGSLADAAETAERGAALTAGMRSARAGRSAAVPEGHLVDVEDPGAAAIAIIFQAAVR